MSRRESIDRPFKVPDFSEQEHGEPSETPLVDSTAEPSPFVPPEEAATALGGLAGNLSDAEHLLDDEPTVSPDDNTEAVKPEENSVAESDEQVDFAVPRSVLSDLDNAADVPEMPDLSPLEPSGEQQNPHEAIRESILEEINAAIETWQQYWKIPYLRVPRDIEQFGRFMRDFEGTIDRLAAIKLDMIEHANGATPAGENIGESLHVVMVPWEFFYKHGDQDTIKMVREMRLEQGIEEHVLDYPSFLKESHTGLQYFRRGSRAWFHDGNVELGGYLSEKRDTDGWWGLVLAQTGASAGQAGAGTPNELTRTTGKDYQVPYRINGYRVDALGYLEWLALTLQEDPRSFSGMPNIMMANYAEYYFKDGNSKEFVAPWSVWDEKDQRLAYGWFIDSEDSPYPDHMARLAIHPAEKKQEPEESAS